VPANSRATRVKKNIEKAHMSMIKQIYASLKSMDSTVC
jgi:hypothetical protein